jgi:c-di-GMP-related signal transduction protein
MVTQLPMSTLFGTQDVSMKPPDLVRSRSPAVVSSDYAVCWQQRKLVIHSPAGAKIVTAMDFILQPIIRLNDRSVYSHEILYRGPSTKGDWGAVDLAMLECFAKHRITSSLIFINVSHQALIDIPAQAFIDAARNNNLFFEFSEEVIDQSTLAEAMRKVNALSARGVRFAIDDFGNGMDGYKRLFSMDRVSAVKVDGELLFAAYQRKHAASMLHAMVSHWNAQGIITIAECIENESLMEFALSLEFNMGQGYLFDDQAAQPIAIAL